MSRHCGIQHMAGKKLLFFTTSLIISLLFVLPVSAQEFDGLLIEPQIQDVPVQANIHQTLDIRNIFADYYTWAQSGADGFGNANNSRFTLQEFKGYSYAFSLSLVNITSIWRTADGTTWTQINPGWTTDPNNEFIYRMYEYNDYLYASLYNPADGMEVWRTADGTTWTQVNTDGFGNANNLYGLLLEDTRENGDLYALIGNLADGAQIWKTSDGTTWTQATVPDTAGDSIFVDLVVFNDYLYTSSYNALGSHVYRSTDGNTWQEVSTGTFTDTLYVYFQTYKDELYGMENHSAGFTANGNRLWKTSDGTAWTQSDYDGFSDADNNRASHLINFNDMLIVSNGNLVDGGKVLYSHNGSEWWSVWSGDSTAGLGDANNTFFYITQLGNAVYLSSQNTVTGTEVFRTTGGSDAVRFNDADGFGNANNEYSNVYALNNNVYAATYNDITGSEIWKTQATPATISDFTGIRKLGKIKFSWSVPSGNEISSYTVRCRTESLTEENWDDHGYVEKNKAAASGASRESLTLGNLTPGQKYWCGVKAVNSINGVSDLSNTISRIVKLGKVRNLEVYNVKTNRATVSWQAPEGAKGMVKKYILQLRSKKGHPIKTFKKIKKTTKVIKAEYLEPGKTYKVKVRTVDNYKKKYKFTKYKKFTTKTEI